jgi:DNA-binding protein Fis
LIRLIKNNLLLGYHPNGIEILLMLIDLELGLIENPLSEFVLAHLAEGYSHREIERITGINRKTLSKTLKKLRETLLK